MLKAAQAKDPNNAQILIHKSFVYADKAQNPTFVRDQKNNFEKAYELADAAARMGTDRYSKARALYNRACFGCYIYPDRKNNIENDLREAIKLDERFGEMAKHDPDFSGLSKDPEFQSIIGSPN